MSERIVGVIEQLLDRLIAGDWAGYGALLSPDAERIGPWGDRMVGRDRIVEMMAGMDPPGNDAPKTTWEVHRIAYGSDGRSGFARVTAHPARGGILEFDQTLAFVMDHEGLVSAIEVFWQTPWVAPPGLGSTSSKSG